MKNLKSDIFENEFLDWDKDILKILLTDKTTKKNIIWATDDYQNLGYGFSAKNEIHLETITIFNSKIIKPRVSKKQESQDIRTKEKAEVFTPSWVCNLQNNLADEQWFGRKDIFNVSQQGTWITNLDKIQFPIDKTKSWEKYIDSKRMEISCGEAPYLVSRYDTVTGKIINVKDRIGLLDRKIRIINENTNSYDNWIKWVIRAFESTYGYEYQGDNLLIARENLLHTFVDNLNYKFSRKATISELKTIANIIAWNIWQMDGTTYTVPCGAIQEKSKQLCLFEEMEVTEFNQIYCRIKDWRSNKSIEFISLLGGI